MMPPRQGAVRRGLARLREPPPLGDPWASAVFEQSHAALALVDQGGNLLRANEALARLLGRDLTSLTKMAEFVMQETSWPYDSGRQQNTHLRHAAGNAVPVRMIRHGPSGAIALLEFVPEPQDAAAQVHAARLQAVGALAGGIAHDFNNILQAIGAAAESLRDGSSAGTGAQEEAAIIAAGVARGSTLVRQLLAFSRQQTLVPRVLPMNAAVEAIASLLARTLGERIRLDLRLDLPGRHVRIDPGQLDQVLLNLAVNARDAMPGGGTLSLATARRTVLVPTAVGGDIMPPGRYVQLEVRDTGHGIPGDVLPHIFEPFFTTRDGPGQGGTGLGLATVQGIVRQSGGFIEVDTNPGKGTTFRVLLPRADPDLLVGSAPAPMPVSAAHDQPRTLLLVEDEEPARRLAARALQRQGWTVQAASDGEAALALLSVTSDLSCIVTDLVMSGMDGVAVVEAVRAKLDRPGLPAVVVSGYADSKLRDSLVSLGARFLAKPYALRDLVACVGEAAGGTNQLP